MSNKKMETATVKIEFCYEDFVDNKSWRAQEKRVSNYVENTSEVICFALFLEGHKIIAVITFNITDKGGSRVYQYLNQRLRRLINGHKQAASYSWATKSESVE